MPLYTRASRAPRTVYAYAAGARVSVNAEGNSGAQFRLPLFYEPPKHQTEIDSDTTTSLQTSYLIHDSSDSESRVSTETTESCAMLKRHLLAVGHFLTDDSSGSSESGDSGTTSDVSYSVFDTPTKADDWLKPAFVFICEGSGPITCIAAARVGQAWVCRNNDKSVHLYHSNGHKKETRVLVSKVHDMCLRHDGVLLVMPHQSQSLKRLQQSGRLAVFVKFELATSGVCSTSRNESLVTTSYDQASQQNHPRPRKKPSIIRLTQAGKVLWEIKTNGTDPFVKPTKIAVSKDGNICVIDLAQSREHVSILSPDGTLKGKYFGITDPVLSRPFDPKDVCYDKRGYIYVSDLCNSAIHVLDHLGKFLRFLLIKNNGVTYPGALTFDSEGYLWVGCSSGHVLVYNVDKCDHRETP